MKLHHNQQNLGTTGILMADLVGLKRTLAGVYTCNMICAHNPDRKKTSLYTKIDLYMLAIFEGNLHFFTMSAYEILSIDTMTHISDTDLISCGWILSTID